MAATTLCGGDAASAACFRARLVRDKNRPAELANPKARALARSILAAGRCRAAALRSWTARPIGSYTYAGAAYACGAASTLDHGDACELSPAVVSSRRVARELLVQGGEAIEPVADSAAAYKAVAHELSCTPDTSSGADAGGSLRVGVVPSILPTAQTAVVFAADASAFPRRLLPSTLAEAPAHSELPGLLSGGRGSAEASGEAASALRAEYEEEYRLSSGSLCRPSVGALHFLSALHESDLRTRSRRTKAQRADDERVAAELAALPGGSALSRGAGGLRRGAACVSVLEASEGVARRLQWSADAAVAAAVGLGLHRAELGLQADSRRAARLPEGLLRMATAHTGPVAMTLRRCAPDDLARAMQLAIPATPMETTGSEPCDDPE